MILLETAFCPPISYMAAIANEFTLPSDRVNCFIPGKVCIEACENYQKQSYRNRCKIYGANGTESLSFPVVHEEGTYALPIRSIRVDYSTDWTRTFERAVVSAYKSSAWFDYYKDEFFAIIDSRIEHLFDMNMALLKYFLDKTHIPAEISTTVTFFRKGSHDAESSAPATKDLRGVIHPKKDNTILRDLELEKPYYQVFSRKYGFIQDLSVMDLLFNEGPDSLSYLKNIRTSNRK